MPSRYYNNPHFNPFGPQTNAPPRFLPGFSGLGRLGFRGFGIGQEMVGGDVDLQVYKPPPPPAVAPPPPPWWERESLLSFLPNWLTSRRGGCSVLPVSEKEAGFGVRSSDLGRNR